MSFELNTQIVGEDEDQFLKLQFGEDGVTAEFTLTLHFEGDWRSIFNNQDPDEKTARAALTKELFALVLNEFEFAGANVEKSGQDASA